MLISVMKIRSTLYSVIDEYFRSADFYEVAPPILTPFSCEVACVGGSDLISVDYYGHKTYLSQSVQLYLELLALQLGKVYCIAPAFRAESSLLSTHLAEFWMCEAELLNINFDDLIQIVNDLLVKIIQAVLSKHGADLEELSSNAESGSSIKIFENIVAENFHRMTYSEAIDILKHKRVLINWGDNIQPYHEKLLSEYLNNYPLIITHYPKSLSSFYKAVCPNNKDVTLSFDVIAPHGYRELVGGSLREVDGGKLRDSLLQAKVDSQPYEWYINMIAESQAPHGGFGLGIERMVSWLCNLRTIQDAIPFPRTENSVWP